MIYSLYYNLLIFILIILNTNSTLLYNNNFFKKKDIYNKLLNYSNNKLKNPIILNGIKTPLKTDFCRMFSDNNSIKYKEYTFDNFILKKPHLKYNNYLIYIKDYLVGNGRILNSYEEELLLSLNIYKNKNIIILEADNIDTIPYKDIHINSRFERIEFPIIAKKEIIHYINDIILHYQYSDDLFLLNWEKYNIEVLDFEKINILLFELDSLIKEENIGIKEIHNCIEHIINGLK